MGFFSKGLKNEFETAVVNEPSVFEPLKFYCTYLSNGTIVVAYTMYVNGTYKRVGNLQILGHAYLNGPACGFLYVS